MKKSTLKFLAIAMFLFMGTYVMAQTQYNITFQVDMTNAEEFNADTDAVYISGATSWDQPGTNEALMLAPLDVGSMIYAIILAVDSGEVMYKYFRVIDGTPSWDNGEWTGDPNRKIYITGDATLENVWANMPYDITFNVDMTGADPFDPATDAIYIGGDLANGWAEPGSMSPYMMTSEDDIHYTITLLLYPGDYFYKYFRVIDGAPSWDNGEWTGDPNREVTADTMAATIDNGWGDLASIFTQPNQFTYSMYPNPVITLLNIGNTLDVSLVEVFDVTGKLVKTVQVQFAQSVTVDVANLQAGVYIVNVTNNSGTQSSKFIKN